MALSLQEKSGRHSRTGHRCRDCQQMPSVTSCPRVKDLQGSL